MAPGPCMTGIQIRNLYVEVSMAPATTFALIIAILQPMIFGSHNKFVNFKQEF